MAPDASRGDVPASSATTASNGPAPLHDVRMVPAWTLRRSGRVGVVELVAAGSAASGVEIAAAVRHHAVASVVCLVPADELERRGAPLESVRAGATAAAAFDHFPVAAGLAPPEPDIEPLYVGTMAHVADRVAAGETVLFHVVEGDGRGALALASVMVLCGVEVQRAQWTAERILRRQPPEAPRDFLAGLVGDGGAPVVEPRVVSRSAAAPAVAAPSQGVTGAVTRVLRALGWRFEVVSFPTGTAFRMGVTCRAGTYSTLVLVRAGLGVTNVYVRVPIIVPAPRRPAAAVLLSELNRKRVVGAFEFASAAGEVTLRADIPSLGTVPSDRTIELVLSLACAAVDDAVPLIARVAFGGEDPLQVIGGAPS
jgi:hypothetical protein